MVSICYGKSNGLFFKINLKFHYSRLLYRANGKSFVCDVNGFSFVKNSNKYYDDCAKILGNMILRELAPTLHIPWSVPFQLDDPPIVPTTFVRPFIILFY